MWNTQNIKAFNSNFKIMIMNSFLHTLLLHCCYCDFVLIFCIWHLDLLWTHIMFAFRKVPLEFESFHLWLNGGFLAHQHSAVYKSYFNVQRSPRIRRVLGLEKLRNKYICDSLKFDKLFDVLRIKIQISRIKQEFEFDTVHRKSWLCTKFTKTETTELTQNSPLTQPHWSKYVKVKNHIIGKTC